MSKNSREAKGSSCIILLFTFIVVFSVMLLSMRMVDLMEYSEHGIPLWKGQWEDVPARYRVPFRIEGRLSKVEYPEWGYGPEAFSRYTHAMTLDTTKTGLGKVPTKVYLWDTEGGTGLIPSSSASGFDLGDATFSKWVQALYEGWIVEVEGYAFDLMQEGSRVTLFGAEKLLPTRKSDIVYMNEKVHASSQFGGVAGVGTSPRPTPTWFQAGRVHTGDLWQDNDVYRGVWMEAGETIKYYFKSYSPIRFQLVYSNCSSFFDWESELTLIDESSTTTSLADLTAEWDGFYIFGFEGGDPASIVVFSAYRETEGEVLMPAWLLGGKTDGGSGQRFDVNMSDLQQFPHLIEAFKEDAKSSAVHADHMTYCPAEEAYRIIEFFGEEYVASESNYGYKLTSEDGSFYSFGMSFGWAPPLVS
jgi:hypothetical protein